MVDCAEAFENHGCYGGLPSQAFEYIHHVGGIERGSDYEYHAKDESCKFDASKTAITVQGSYNITEGDEVALIDAIANMGPVSIAYQVNKDFRNYKNGTFTSDSCGTTTMDVNHAVLAVGYNDAPAEGELPYYIIKNSWGETWGMGGYF